MHFPKADATEKTSSCTPFKKMIYVIFYTEYCRSPEYLPHQMHFVRIRVFLLFIEQDAHTRLPNEPVHGKQTNCRFCPLRYWLLPLYALQVWQRIVFAGFLFTLFCH